jgi:hypothetical protein
MAAMCNLYSVTKGQQAIREFTRAMTDRTGNLPLLPGIFPDYAATSQRGGNWSWPAGARRHLSLR